MPVATSQHPPRPRGNPGPGRAEPVLITEAELSRDEQHAARKKRYAITMGIRAVAITLAAVFYQTVWLMAIFAVLGVVLPWVAVLMANDRPPKRKLFQGYDARPDRVLEARPARVIDV
jgi:Protein of unknown function (DUF3099)